MAAIAVAAGGQRGLAVGEFERERERRDRRRTIPVEPGAELRGAVADDHDQDTEPERAGDQRRELGRAGRVSVSAIHHTGSLGELAAAAVLVPELAGVVQVKLGRCQRDAERDSGAAAEFDHEVPAAGGRVVLDGATPGGRVLPGDQLALLGITEVLGLRQAGHLLGWRAPQISIPERSISPSAFIRSCSSGSESRSLIVCEHITTPTPHWRFKRVRC